MVQGQHIHLRRLECAGDQNGLDIRQRDSNQQHDGNCGLSRKHGSRQQWNDDPSGFQAVHPVADDIVGLTAQGDQTCERTDDQT